MQYSITLSANVWTPQAVPGRYICLLSTGAAVSVEVRIVRGSQDLGQIRTAQRGLQAEITGEPFTRVEFRSSIATTVEAVITDGSLRIDPLEGASVNATITNNPLNVSMARGEPGTPLIVQNVLGDAGTPVHVIGPRADDAPGAAIAEPAAVAVTAALTSVIGASATRARLRILNQGPDPVAIGGPGLTWANRAIVLAVGAMWEESSGANLAWSAVCDTAKTATLGVQAITV